MTVKCHRLLKSNCIHWAGSLFFAFVGIFYISQRDSLWFKSHKATSFYLLDIQMQNVTLFHYSMTILVQIKMFLVEEWGPQIGLIEPSFGKLVGTT